MRAKEGAVVDLLPKMPPEAPDGYVSFVGRHLTALRLESAQLAGDAWHAEEIYPEALTDVAARWQWLELLSRWGRPRAADDYLREVLTNRAKRWRAEQIYEVEMVVLRADPAEAADGAGGARGWNGVASDPDDGRPGPGGVGDPAGTADRVWGRSGGADGRSGSDGVDPARVVDRLWGRGAAMDGRSGSDGVDPARVVDRGWDPGATDGRSGLDTVGDPARVADGVRCGPSGGSRLGRDWAGEQPWQQRPPMAPFTAGSVTTSSAGLARYRRTGPGRSSIGARQARFLSPKRRPPAPIAEAAIAWWHAYVAQRRRKRVAAVIGVILLLAALTNLRATGRM
ncbi:hypothetical protein AB0J82_03910 [Asanoa sp. NPDC049518]|uniref:hypothetical protein n=1 Tax=unclassified Asanoa TaxID=2685164 RepID=UPI003448950B